MTVTFWTEGKNRGVNNSSTRNLQSNIIRDESNSIRRLYEGKNKSIDYRFSGYPILTPIEYQKRHEIR